MATNKRNLSTIEDVDNFSKELQNAECYETLPLLKKSAGLYRVESLQEIIRASLEINHRALVINLPNLKSNDLERICRLLGRGASDPRAFGKIRSIRFTGNASSVAESLDSHPMHTDGTFDANPPKKFLLYYDEPDTGFGGLTLLMPLEEIIASLDAEHLVVLLSSPVRYARRDENGVIDEWTGTLLSYDTVQGISCRWRYDNHVKPEPLNPEDTLLTSAINAFRKLVENTDPIRYRAEKHDLLIIPNVNYLHGRTALSRNSKRHLLRAWID